MPESSKVIINDQDNSDQITGATLGVAGFEGITRRGPINRPDLLITSLGQFRKIYGPSNSSSDFAFQCERVLKRGGKLRINSIKHYTTITDNTTLSALFAAPANPIKDATPTSLFSLKSKYPGVDYNSLKVTIQNASNGKAGSFDLILKLTGDEGNALEQYKNITMAPTTIAASHWLDEIIQNSNLAVPTYLDLSAIAQTRPINGTFNFVGGSDGGAVIAADYIGDQGAKNGIYAFDAFDDMGDISIPVISDPTVNDALAVYAETRQDIQALLHLPNSATTAAALVTARGNTDTKYSAYFAGGIVIQDPVSNQPVSFSEIADIININNYVDQTYFPWISRANFVKGNIDDAIGVVNNFGSPGQINDLELLAQNQINMIIAANRKVYLKGNFSGQIEASKASYFAIVRGLIYVKKTIKPVLEKYLEEPADIETFIKLFKEVEPFLDSLTSNEFLYKGAGASGKGYDWQGDQDSTDINNLQFNTKEELDKGNYTVNLLLYPINSIQVLTLNISLNSLSGSVQFSI